jgi:hypothetical protein
MDAFWRRSLVWFLIFFFFGKTYIVAGVAVDIHLACLVFSGGLALSHCCGFDDVCVSEEKFETNEFCQMAEVAVIISFLSRSALLSSSSRFITLGLDFTHILAS